MEESLGRGAGGDGANLAAQVNVAKADNGHEPTESREEGELSCSSDDYHESGPASRFADCNAAQVESVQVASLNKITQDIRSETCKPANKSSSMVDVSSSAYPQLGHRRGSEKNRGQFVPFVIRFSDDDSESDSDDSRHNILESKDTQADKSKRPPLPSIQKSQNPLQNRVKEARLMPRQMSLSRPGVSSKAKINGATSSSAGHISSCRNLNHPKKEASQDQQHRKNVHLNASKMQDLRQLIEIRENQMKLKTTQQTRNPFSGLYGDQSTKNPSNPVSRVRKAAQVHDLRSNLNNPDKKRLKTGEQQSSNLCPECCKNFHAMGDMLPPGKSMSNNCGKQNVEHCSYCGKNVALRTSHASQLGDQKQNAQQASMSSANPLTVGKDGVQVVASSILDDGNTETMGPIVSPAQTGQTRERPAGDFPLKQAPATSASFLNCLDKLSIKGSNNMDILSMLDFEDLLDKELEEAQEHRRKSEIDERNALTAYRKAQRALVEANARCAHLYSKRELYSAQLRSLMMENPNQFFSLKPHDQTEAGLSVPNKISNVDVHPMPTSSHHVQAVSDINGRRGCDFNIPPSNSAYQNQSHVRVDGQNLVSDPCIEPDGSSSEAYKHDDVSHGVCSPSDDTAQSADEDDEIFQLKPKSAPDNWESVQTSEASAGRDKERNHESPGQPSLDSQQDSLLLEASLRSQLYEKLRMKKLLKRDTGQIMESANESFGNDDGGKMMATVAENASLHEAEINKHSRFKRVNEPEGFSELSVHISSRSNMIPSEHASLAVGDLTKRDFSLEGLESTISVTFLCPAMKSAFTHLKVTKPVGVLQSQPKSSDMLSSDINEKGGDLNVHTENQKIRPNAATTEQTALSLYDQQSGYYSCNLAIDPLWPLCMFELRGKCNNDKCPWQHVKDYFCDSMQHDAMVDTDCQVERASQRKELSSTAMASKSLDHLLLVPPTYMVGSDVLRPNSQSYTSLLAQDYGQCWQRCFSNFLVLSSLFAKASVSNEPFLHGTEARIEVHSDWNRQSSYFHSRNGGMGQFDHSDDQSLEMALLNFRKEANKQEGRIEALKVLAPAIEANPRSAVLWMVYLQIYYSHKSIGNDDLFEYAVEFNKESYELWLLYINSREQLDDRLAAYDAAFSALSHHASTANGDASYASQCILDIFLQMMDFMCSSGNVGRAIGKISGLILSTKEIDEPCQPIMPNVISCLTICDKFIFWISCVYLVIYRKLPLPVLHSFECWKESSILEWPDVYPTFDEKQQAGSLMEMAVDSLASYMDRDALENEKTLQAAHLFALNHVRCVSVLEGLECSRLLLEKYTKLYPSCLELVLMAARVQYHIGGLSFDGFEEALGNWPDEFPGVQCIWNQYAECALQSGKLDFVKELMDRWLQSVKKAQDLHHEVLHTSSSDDPSLLHSAAASDVCAWFSGYSQTDNVFGILNLSLYKILQDDYTDALFALTQALKAASANNYCHCLRELTMFLLTSSVQHFGEASVKRILSILNVHLADGQAWVAAEPLSIVFIQKVGRPRVRQLVSKMLRPISANFSLMNMVVEVWYGLLLIPQIYDNLMDLVDFVEGMMEIMPSNYLLAISVCKLLIKSPTVNNSASISFWASTLLVNALSHAVPVAPEYVWSESAELLLDLTDSQKIGESFHKKALSVYPFSLELWKSYLRLSEAAEHGNAVKEAARKKGILLH